MGQYRKGSCCPLKPKNHEDIIEKPEIKIHKYNKDFYFGFYCTSLGKQAERWATRYGGTGFVNEYKYVSNDNLNIKIFSEMTEEWLDFIVACRMGQPHNYDIVEEPMADDTIFIYVQNYVDGKITREAFWGLAKFKKPTHQISFNTEAAWATLKFISAKEVTDDDE